MRQTRSIVAHGPSESPCVDGGQDAHQHPVREEALDLLGGRARLALHQRDEALEARARLLGDLRQRGGGGVLVNLRQQQPTVLQQLGVRLAQRLAGIAPFGARLAATLANVSYMRWLERCTTARTRSTFLGNRRKR